MNWYSGTEYSDDVQNKVPIFDRKVEEKKNGEDMEGAEDNGRHIDPWEENAIENISGIESV